MSFFALDFREDKSKFKVLLKNLFTNKELIWQIHKIKENEKKWIKHIYEIKAFGLYEILFHSQKGGVAIDEIEIIDCPNEEDGRIKNSPKLLECNFHKDFCSYTQNSNILKIGLQTPSTYTGPQKPYKGNFCYFEASQLKHKATLTSKIIEFNETKCLTFVYYLFGKDIGKFYVTLKTIGNGKNEIILKKIGNQGEKWFKFNHTIKFDPKFPVEYKI